MGVQILEEDIEKLHWSDQEFIKKKEEGYAYAIRSLYSPEFERTECITPPPDLEVHAFKPNELAAIGFKTIPFIAAYLTEGKELRITPIKIKENETKIKPQQELLIVEKGSKPGSKGNCIGYFSQLSEYIIKKQFVVPDDKYNTDIDALHEKVFNAFQTLNEAQLVYMNAWTAFEKRVDKNDDRYANLVGLINLTQRKWQEKAKKNV